MKKTISNIWLSATLFSAAAFMTACSNNEEETGAATATKQTWTVTLSATKGGNAPQSRALSLSGKTLNAAWATTEKIYATKSGEDVGTLQPQSDGATADLKGELTGEFAAGDALQLTYPRATIDYSGQTGTLDDIAEKYDYATATLNVTAVDAMSKTLTATGGSFTSQQAVVKFILQDTDGNALSATDLTVSADGLKTTATETSDITITPTTASSELFAALSGLTTAATVTLTATVGDETYSYEKSGVSFAHGKYYEVTVKMRNISTFSATASNITSVLSEFNASPAENPTLTLTENIGSELTITRDDGVVDFANHSVQQLFLQNSTAGKTITLKNGTITKEIDGKAEWNDYYQGTVVLENMTILGSIFTDGHRFEIISGTYDAIENNTKASYPGIVIIYGGSFGTFDRITKLQSRQTGTYMLYGGKFKTSPSASNMSCADGYSIQSNTGEDSGSYPYIVSAD